VTSDIWSACRSAAEAIVLEGAVWRLVESQEQVATNSLVHTLAEQALLEQLIESTKPAPPPAAAGLHYLLLTPFRYPPLRYGSRFGRRTEPSLYYGSRGTQTVLAESAYYRFVFWSGMETAPDEPLNTRHTVFCTDVRTARGLRLQEPPFAEFADRIRDRSHYDSTQALGTAMRESGIEAFEYCSARDEEGGINVALFSPAALASRRPHHQVEWLCETRAQTVRFYSHEAHELRQFPLQQFLVDGALPTPAT
jgi:RES domain